MINMLNQIILVGRILQLPQDNMITLAVSRSYKNTNGEYETDFIPIEIPHTLISSTMEYLYKGDIVGIKGRIQSTTDHNETPQIKIVAERVTFLSSHSTQENIQPQPQTQTQTTNSLNEGEI